MLTTGSGRDVTLSVAPRHRPTGRPWTEFRHAWRAPWVRLGTLATTLIVIGSLTPAYLPRNSPWWGPVRFLHLDGLVGKVLGTVVVMAGLALLIQAWLRVRPTIRASVAWWGVLCWWSLPLLLAPPVFSHDAYSYAAQGWLMHHGLNPYEVGPGTLPGAFADQAPWEWRNTPTPYGPLSLVLQWGLVEFTGYQPYAAALMMRLPALAGVGLIAVYVPKLAQRMGVDPADAAWLAVLNPLLVVDFIGGAHNDAQMMGLVMLGIWVAWRYHWVWGALVIGVAAALKQPALLAAVALPLLGRAEVPTWRWTWWRSAASVALAVGSFAAVSWATGYGFGWVNAIGVPGLVVTISPFTLLGQGLQYVVDALGADPTGHTAIRYTRAVGMVLTGALVAWLALTRLRRRPLAFLSWSYLAVALGAPALHGWYLLWGGVLLPLIRPGPRLVRAWVWATVLLLAYAAINMSWRNGNVALGVAGVSLLLWIAAHYHRTEVARDA